MIKSVGGKTELEKLRQKRPYSVSFEILVLNI